LGFPKVVAARADRNQAAPASPDVPWIMAQNAARDLF
jgi:hypothetical protein